MKDKIKKILLINLIFLTLPYKISSSELIIPKKKPIIFQEDPNIVLSSNFLLPSRKPNVILDENIENNDVSKKLVKNIINGIIVPKTKPLVVKKDKNFALNKSKYFTEKDFKIANQSIKLMEKRNWFEAE